MFLAAHFPGRAGPPVQRPIVSSTFSVHGLLILFLTCLLIYSSRLGDSGRRRLTRGGWWYGMAVSRAPTPFSHGGGAPSSSRISPFVCHLSLSLTRVYTGDGQVEGVRLRRTIPVGSAARMNCAGSVEGLHLNSREQPCGRGTGTLPRSPCDRPHKPPMREFRRFDM